MARRRRSRNQSTDSRSPATPDAAAAPNASDASASADRGGGWGRPGALASCAAAAILGAFVYAKIPGFRPDLSDENIYYYMATAILRGSLPYRDFFYANPPGLLIVLSAVGALSGSAFAAFKAVPLIAALTSGLLLFLLLQDRWRHGAAPLFGLAVYLFSYDQLRASSHGTGVGVTVGLVMAGLLLVWRRFPALGGGLMAAAALVKTFGLVGFPALLALAWLRGGRREGLRFLAGFGAVFAAVNLLCLLLFGGDFVRQTVLYHLNKPETRTSNAEVFMRVLGRNLPLTALALAGGLMAGCRIGARRGGSWRDALAAHALETASAILLLSLAVFMALQKRVFDFYLVMGFPFAAMLAAAVVPWFWPQTPGAEAAAGGRRPFVPPDPRDRRMRFLGTRLGVALPAAVLLAFLPFGGRADLWGWLPGYLSYLRHESRFFEKAPYIAADLAGEMLPSDRIFGDSAAVPAVAVMGRLRIWEDEADTNVMRFRSGATDPGDLVRRLNADRPRFVLLRIPPGGRGYSGIGLVDEFGRWVTDHYRMLRKWSDTKSTYFLFEENARYAERMRG